MVGDEIFEKVFSFRDSFIKKYYDRVFYGYQLEPSNTIIKAALSGRGEEFFVEISRQAGKTEMICCTIVFLLIFAKKFMELLGMRLYTPGWYVVIGAPQKEQAKTDFDRIKDYLSPPCKDFGISFEESNATTIKLSNGSIAYCFPISPTANIESKTAHFILVEEAQDILDQERNKKLLPMGTATNAPIVNIGTAGYKVCNFYKGLTGSNKDRVFIYDCWEVIKQKKEAFLRDQNPWHLNYERFVKRQIREKGESNPEVQSQYFLKWQLEKGMWMTEEEFNKLLRPELDLVREDLEHDCLVGIDVAKESDVTFVSVWRREGVKRVKRRAPSSRVVEPSREEMRRYEEALRSGFDPGLGRPKKPSSRVETFLAEEEVEAPVFRLLNWMMIKGVLYQHQWEVISDFLSHYRVWKLNIDSTGVGDATADYFLEKYNGWSYDVFQRMERLGVRGVVRPVKFTPLSKHRMYSNFEIAIKEGRVLIPANTLLFSPPEKACFERFRLESLSALREWRGSLLVVRHPDRSRGESGEVETDDSLDSAALVFFDPDDEPVGFEMESI